MYVERDILPSVEQTLAQLQGARVFTKLDANSGFWQIKAVQRISIADYLYYPSRFCFNRLPFGITSAPEFYQKKMSHMLSGLQGVVVCMMDDVLVFGKTKGEHDQRLMAVFDRIKKAGATLNADKCEFSVNKVKFLGHVIDGAGIHPDPDKVCAILQLKTPTNVTDLRRFLGMVT